MVEGNTGWIADYFETNFAESATRRSSAETTKNTRNAVGYLVPAHKNREIPHNYKKKKRFRTVYLVG